MNLKQTFCFNDRFISLLSPKHMSTKIIKEHLIFSKTVRNVKIKEGEKSFQKEIFGDQFTANKIY